MPQPEGPTSVVIVYSAEDKRACTAVRARWHETSAQDGCCMATCSLPPGRSVSDELGDEALLVSIRYLDRYHLVQDVDSESSTRPLSLLFFERISADYDSIVNIERNRHNVAILLSALLEGAAPDSDRPILDFGCGTGLALKVAQAHGVQLMGVDACGGMRSVARGRGLAVFAADELSSSNARGMFSSYVFHLLERPDELQHLWSLLPADACLVANFHKGRNVERVTTWLNECGAKATELAVDDEGRGHGVYVKYTK